MSKVFVLDTEHRPLNPIPPGRARVLLNQGKAAVYRRFPFTLILKYALPEAEIDDLRLKLDPGSKITGVAVVNDASGEVVFAAELKHRGQQIKAALDDRRAIRRGRRARHTRYRQPRFLNRRRSAGWLAPSLMSRVHNILNWAARLRRLCNITTISQELVRFDTQLMQNPEISGVEYQQGELAGYEVRQYLLEKWGRRCAYCGKSGVPLEIEHIIPKSRGGSDRVSNLTIACHDCNQEKSNRTAAEFGHPKVQAHARLPLKDAAAVNSTRWRLYHELQATGLPVEVGSGGLTKFNRSVRNLPKTHWLDAACVGHSTPKALIVNQVRPLLITATGHGKRQMCGTNKYGFPIHHRARQKRYFGFVTGDMVRANVPGGKQKGRHIGRVVVRKAGWFHVGMHDGISYKHITILQRLDGYSYLI